MPKYLKNMSYKLSLYSLVLSIDSVFKSHYLWDKVSIGKFSLEKKLRCFILQDTAAFILHDIQHQKYSS